MNSGIYIGSIHHARKAITSYSFTNNLPWWLIDLDELEVLKTFWGFNHNQWGALTFRDYDHISQSSGNLKENILEWARWNGVTQPIKQVLLLTNLRTWGYVFNPVSFYFLQGESLRWIVIEIGNTFWEQKPTLVGPFTGDEFQCEIPKLFYISPFLPMDNTLKLSLTWPKQSLSIKIEDYSTKGELELTASFRGKRHEVNQKSILAFIFKYPFLCLSIIGLIHWHAFKLWWLKIPYFKKSDHPELQQGVFKWKSRKFEKQS